jgi:hypothetical protein
VPAKGKTVARGYGAMHKRLRRLAIARHPYCECCNATRDLTADHIVPLSRGGGATLTNYRVLCRRCNSSKADRDAPKRPVKPRARFSRQSLNDDGKALNGSHSSSEATRARKRVRTGGATTAPARRPATLAQQRAGFTPPTIRRRVWRSVGAPYAARSSRWTPLPRQTSP